MLRFSPILAPNIMDYLKTIKKKDKKYLFLFKKKGIMPQNLDIIRKYTYFCFSFP